MTAPAAGGANLPPLPKLANPDKTSIDKAALQKYASEVEKWFNNQPMDPSVAGKAKAALTKFRKVVGELLAIPDGGGGGGGAGGGGGGAGGGGGKPAGGGAPAPA
jgi:hypothetical protein